MNQDRKEKDNFFIKTLNRIRKWPDERKRNFSLMIAILLTILIIVFNVAVNMLWKDNVPKKNYQKEPFSEMKESFSQAFSSSESMIQQASSNTAQIVSQLSTTSSSFASTTSSTSTTSFSSTSNVVE
jgi:predicted PurR-regulated permease PerM